MRFLHIALIHHGIVHGRIDLGMPQQHLHLLDGHPLVNGQGGHGSPELVRMHTIQMKPSAEGAQPDFNAADVEPFMGRIQADEQRLVIIGAAVQIVAQMQLGSGIEVDRALLGALAEHDALPVGKVDICAIQAHQLPDAHACRGKQIDDGQIAQGLAAVPQGFKALVRVDRFDHLGGFHLVNAPDGALDDVVLILQPCKEAGQDAPHIVDGRFPGAALLLILIQIPAEIIRRDGWNWLGNGCQHLFERRFVIPDGSVGAALHPFCGDEGREQVCVGILVLCGRDSHMRHCFLKHVVKQALLVGGERGSHGLLDGVDQFDFHPYPSVNFFGVRCFFSRDTAASGPFASR